MISSAANARAGRDNSLRTLGARRRASSRFHDDAPMDQRVGARQDDHAPVWFPSEHFNGTFELRRIASTNDYERHREGW
jgi:hypothetical protein